MPLPTELAAVGVRFVRALHLNQRLSVRRKAPLRLAVALEVLTEKAALHAATAARPFHFDGSGFGRSFIPFVMHNGWSSSVCSAT